MSLRVSVCVDDDTDSFLIRPKEVLEISPRGLIERPEGSDKTIGEETLDEATGAIAGSCHDKAG